MATSEEQNAFRIFLRLLAVAQIGVAVIAGFALALIWMLYDDTAARASSPNRAAELHALSDYRAVAIVMALGSVTVLVGGLISAVCIWRRRSRGFSRCVAVISLLLFPIGTAIGLTTLIVLGQKPIRDLYEA